ncbi:hypothetical protein BpHYR1_010970 [Brachionus plicatilis]|uniref:Uncharacterized protein n=1 Tax=Brachionus plicatilis TaxID=10195 RepID=A0A3M7T0V5_BRAPC|nr:hypothetical protein BpHYR1_010970 [Brachionus plicatilis]
MIRLDLSGINQFESSIGMVSRVKDKTILRQFIWTIGVECVGDAKKYSDTTQRELEHNYRFKLPVSHKY